jgi:putative ABC transport system permease protein
VQLDDGDPLELTVTGVARDQELAPGWMEHVVYAFVTPATLARLGGSAQLNQLQIVVRAGDSVSFDRDANRRVALNVKAAVEAAGHRVIDVDVAIPGHHMHAGQMNSLLMIQGAFGVLALLLSAFLVVNLISAMLAGQVREIGVMKAVGARASQIVGMYLALAFALGLIACVVAIPAAAIIGRSYAEFTAGMLNFNVSGVGIPARIIAAQILVGTLMPVIAAAVPAMRGCRISVADALRDFGVGMRDPGADDGILRLAHGIARPLLLSLRNAFRRRERMALTLLTLALGGSVFLGALELRTGIRRSVGLIYDSYNKYDFLIRFSQPHEADSVEAVVRRIPGVAAAEAWTGARAAVDHADAMYAAPFPIVGAPADSKLIAFPVAAGRWFSGDAENELVVSKLTSDDEPSLVPGAEVMLTIDGRPARWRVVGVLESGPLPAAFASREAIARARGETRMRSVAVRAADRSIATDPGLIERARDALGRAGFDVESSQLVQANRAAVESHLLLVVSFLMAMAQLALLIGGLGLASTVSLSVLERTREIGVLRAIGASHSSILWMVQIEGLVISMLSWLLAIPLSVPMSLILGRAFGKVMFPVPPAYVPEASGVAIWFGVVLGVSLLACAWPARRATRITTAAALAYE